MASANSVNMVVSVGPEPSYLSWMAHASTDGWKIDSPNSVPGGTTTEVTEFTERMDSSSKTPWQRTLELAARIGYRSLRVVVDSF